MVPILSAVTLALFAGDVPKSEPAHVGAIIIVGNDWTADAPIREALELYPGTLLPDEAALLRAEIRMLVRFHDRFDFDAGKKPTIKVASTGTYRDIWVDFPERKPATRLVDRKPPNLTGPTAVYRDYLDAIRAGDLVAAKKCWVTDDDDKSGALDVIAGMWITFRRLDQVASQKFGADALPENWRRDDISDKALRLARNRLDDAKVEIDGDVALVRLLWMHSDADAFFFGLTPIRFRKVSGQWKIDANAFAGLERTSDFFDKGTWGRMFREVFNLMNQAVDAMEQGKLKSRSELRTFFAKKIKALVKVYSRPAEHGCVELPTKSSRK